MHPFNTIGISSVLTVPLIDTEPFATVQWTGLFPYPCVCYAYKSWVLQPYYPNLYIENSYTPPQHIVFTIFHLFSIDYFPPQYTGFFRHTPFAFWMVKRTPKHSANYKSRGFYFAPLAVWQKLWSLNFSRAKQRCSLVTPLFPHSFLIPTQRWKPRFSNFPNILGRQAHAKLLF